ncbi:TRAP transporter large permease subunit [Streptomyces purpurogeneiscleroticus]|uniref:TRAP transporter large permease subunit n=1 Tax=Streptomyces purpurogeneiscleroticus TaxID=68259 RepID=UPI001CC0E493|nr:TRAP transporter large permease subunit [Streptomyces purpurogeneiscleroticus]MBZ4016586.1 C4-dicarboxylate ABC transporter permease [Streptomyces purpurogeneiscleroticus]
MIAVWALGCYIAAIIVWNSVLRRNIGEALLVGFLVTGLFAGGDIGHVMWSSFAEAMQEEVTFAALAFVFMSYLLARTPVLDHLLDILNSLLGRLRGGPIYTSTVASGVFGAIAHVGAAITAAVGSVTIPWMKRSNVSGEIAATVAAGGAGMGVTFPFSSTMFILMGSAGVASVVSTDEIVLPLFLGGLWCLGYRLLAAFVMVRRYGIRPVDTSELQPLRRTLGAGWTSLLLFGGIAIPLLLTRGPLAGDLGRYVGATMSDAISLITWIPVLMIAIVLLLGRRHLPHTGRAWWELLGGAAPQFGVLGVTIIAAFSAANALGELGLPRQLTDLLAGVEAPLWAMALVVGVLVVGVAVPLTASATMAAIGPVAVSALIGAGVSPATACVAVLIFASTEGASPPSGAPIFVASGIAGVDPSRTFVPLLTYYCIPILFIGAAVATGVLPV